MSVTESHHRQERRGRDRSEGLLLRRRRREVVAQSGERRRGSNGFDIAAALELHLDQVTTRRAMIALLESWLNEADTSGSPEPDEDYIQAVENAIEVMRAASDPLTAIAVLQRQS